MVVRGRCRTCIAAPSAAVSTALCSACMRRTLQASACSWSKHMPSCTSLMSVCGSMFFAKGSVSGSRIQHRESCRAALPKPASWRYRHTAHTSQKGQANRVVEWEGGKGTEIVHRVAAQSLRHGASCTRCMRPWREEGVYAGIRGVLVARSVAVVVSKLVGESKATCPANCNYSALEHRALCTRASPHRSPSERC